MEGKESWKREREIEDRDEVYACMNTVHYERKKLES